MNIVHRIWQKYTPGILLNSIRILFEPKHFRERRKALLQHFKRMDLSSLTMEQRDAINYLKKHPFTPFPFRWAQKYDNLMPKVYRDKKHNCFYALFDGKRMYFPKYYTHTHVIWSYRIILKEQDPLSPHRYLREDFQVEPGSIVIDAGVAEGNFALSIIEKAKKLYLIECNEDWMEALKLTFAPWEEKVSFIEKYLSDIPGPTTVSIDSLLIPQEGNKYFIKLDIEGFEQKALSGMKKLIASDLPIKMNVCTYHKPNDYNEIETFLHSNGFSCNGSQGSLLFFQPNEEPSFRRALIRAHKKPS